LAIAEGGLAQPFAVIINTPRVRGKIERICQEQGVEKIVIGLPESGIVGKIKDFGRKLTKITNLPVVYQEEVLTSKEAVAKMIEAGRGRKYRQIKSDAIAAALILQEYLERLGE
jgi:putative Holliday junction resolvase